jgi:hypothetical protein
VKDTLPHAILSCIICSAICLFRKNNQTQGFLTFYAERTHKIIKGLHESLNHPKLSEKDAIYIYNFIYGIHGTLDPLHGPLVKNKKPVCNDTLGTLK